MAPWLTEIINAKSVSVSGIQAMEKNLLQTEINDLEKRCTALRGYL